MNRCIGCGAILQTKDKDKIGFVRKGDILNENSGIAVVMTDKIGGSIIMDMGEKHKNTQFYDYLGNVKEIVTTDENGVGNFYCNNGSVSVWIKNIKNDISY